MKENQTIKDVRKHYLETGITEDYARTLSICLGCGSSKGVGIVVCWDCFKRRENSLKYFDGDFKQWLRALNKK